MMPVAMWNGLLSAHPTMDCTFYSVSIGVEILSISAWTKMHFATKFSFPCQKTNPFQLWEVEKPTRLVTEHAFTAMVKTPLHSGPIFIVVFLATAGQ